MLPHRRASALAVAACLLTAACIAGGAPPAPSQVDAAPKPGGTAVLGSISDIDSWNEYLSQQSFAAGVLRRIYARLARESGDPGAHPDAFEPQLAESWSFSPDRKELTFRLRNAQWSDGKAITASDVRFTWRAQTSPEVPWIAASSKSRIRDVAVVDPLTVRFVFDAAYPFQLADAVEGAILPEHVFSAIPFERWASHDWSAARVGSGPFLLERHVPGQEIALVRNPLYYGKPAYLERVVVRVVPDATSLLAQLRAGDIDYFEGVTPRDAAGLTERQGLSLLEFDQPGYDFIGWNAKRAPFDDREVRRAMTLAIDRDALVAELLHGYGRVSRGPLLSWWWATDPEHQAWGHDPAAACRILEQRGFRVLRPDGTPSAGTQPLAFEMMTNAGNRMREEMLVKIQEQLRRIGVEVEVRTLEMRALRERAASGDFDAYLGGWVYSVRDLRSVFDSGSRPPQGGNVVGYVSPEVDAAFERLDGLSDWRAMQPDLRALERTIHEDQPYTFLYERRRVTAHGPRLAGVRVDPPSDPLAGLETCWVR